METHPVLGETASATTHEGKIETCAVQENEGTCELPSASTTTTATEEEDPSDQLLLSPNGPLEATNGNSASNDEMDYAVGVPAAQPSSDSNSLSDQNPSLRSQQDDEHQQPVSPLIEQLDDGDRDNVSLDEHQEPDKAPADRKGGDQPPQAERSIPLTSISDERTDYSQEIPVEQGEKSTPYGNQEEHEERAHVDDQSSLPQVNPSQHHEQEAITPQFHVHDESRLQNEDQMDYTVHDMVENQRDNQCVDEEQQSNHDADILFSSYQEEAREREHQDHEEHAAPVESERLDEHGWHDDQVVQGRVNQEEHPQMEEHSGQKDNLQLEEHPETESCARSEEQQTMHAGPEEPAYSDELSEEEGCTGREEHTRQQVHDREDELTEGECDTRLGDPTSVEMLGVLQHEIPTPSAPQQDSVSEDQSDRPVVNGTSQSQTVEIHEYQQYANQSRDDASDHTVYNAPRSRRVWEADRHAAECRRCNRRFNFLVRRHHCRRCGLVVCDRCSSHRIRLPPEEIIQDPAIDPSHYPLIAMHPQRVCDTCNRMPIKEITPSTSSPRRRATAPVAMSHMKRSASSQSLMTECPVCGTDLLGMQKRDQEKHLQLCLNTGSPPVRPPRYLVYELSDDSPQIDYECPICFEEFKAGEKIARMICLCSYHRHCLSDWLERGKGCPVHYDATIAA